MKNCFSCKHKETNFSDLYPEKTKDMVQIKENHYGRCNNGDTETMIAFIKEHGFKKRDVVEAEDIQVPCFEPTEGDAILDSMISKTKELIALLKEKNNEKDAS